MQGGLGCYKVELRHQEKSKSKAAWLLGRPQQVEETAHAQKVAIENVRAHEVNE